jgi:hypothetical protein
MHNTIMESTNCIKKATELISKFEGPSQETYQRRFNADSREFKEKLLEIKGLEQRDIETVRRSQVVESMASKEQASFAINRDEEQKQLQIQGQIQILDDAEFLADIIEDR